MWAMCLLTACNSDDDEIIGNSLTGKWDLEEIQNGPSGMCIEDSKTRYPAGSVVIELKENGEMIFNYKDGKVDTCNYSIPADQDIFQSTMPVMTIGQVPFGYTIEQNRLKLHYYGIAYADHIPATFVFKRIR